MAVVAFIFILLLAWFVWSQIRIDTKNIARRETLFKEVSDKLAGSHFVFDRGSAFPEILKLKRFRLVTKPSVPGDGSDSYILASFENIYWDDSDTKNECKLRLFVGDEFEIRKYSQLQMWREFVWRESDIERAISVGMEMKNYRFIDPDELEHRLCDLLFDNMNELDWCISNLGLLSKQIESLSRVREQCKSNELLQPYYKKVIKAVRVLAEQRVEIYSYCSDARESAMKIFEYLSVPAAVKGIDNLNLDPLRVSFKGSELRDSFQKAQELHKQLQQL